MPQQQQQGVGGGRPGTTVAVGGGDAAEDIPSVLAPRRPQGIKLRGATGRPASMHVDDYQRGGGGGPTASKPASPPRGIAPPSASVAASMTGMMPPLPAAPMGVWRPPAPPPPQLLQQQHFFQPPPSSAPPPQSYDSESLYSDLFAPKGGQTGPAVDVFSITGVGGGEPELEGLRVLCALTCALTMNHDFII